MPGSDASAAQLEARLCARMMAMMRGYRVFEMAVCTVGFISINAIIASQYPSTAPIIAVGALSQLACFVLMYLLPDHGNPITAVQLACFFGACAQAGGGRAGARGGGCSNVSRCSRGFAARSICRFDILYLYLYLI